MKVVAMDALLAQQLSESGLVVLENTAGDTATISLYGAQVLSWTTHQRGEQLFCSALATADNGKAIRGGIPVCFPQFSGFGALPKHGFVRTMVWERSGETISGKDASVARASFVIRDSAQTQAHWPHAFVLYLDVSLAENTLEVAVRVNNTGTEALTFTAALHTYLAETDVRKSTVAGLQGQSYIDTTQRPHASCVQTEPLLTIPGEVDSIYYDAPSQLTLHTKEEARLQLGMEGFKDTVVWNPGPELVKALPDMTDCDWVKMLCIEAVQLQHPVNLAPGAEWTGKQQLLAL